MARLWDLKPGWTLHWLEDGDNIACDDCGHCLLFLPTMSEGDVATAVVDDHDAYHLIMSIPPGWAALLSCRCPARI